MTRKFLVLFAIFAVFHLTFATSVFSEDSTPSASQTPTPDPSKEAQKRLQEIAQEQLRIQKELARLSVEKKSLQQAIGILDREIKLTNLKIEETKTRLAETIKQLEQLEREIELLTRELNRLSVALDKVEEVLTGRIRATYKRGNISAVELLVSSEGFSQFLNRFKYLQLIQENDRLVLRQMQLARANFTNQKETLEVKEAEVEKLKAQIEAQKASLETQNAQLKDQRATKQRLLDITKNDEARYQKLLADIRAEQRAISQALGKFIRGGLPAGTPVKRGEIIGVQGSTGFSTGDHVHFEVRTKCGSDFCHTDPMSYLNSGQFSYPLDSYEISQGYGNTDFARACRCYSGDFHTGVDMFGPVGSPVKASADGKVSYAVDALGGKGAIVEHSDNLLTLYWHIQ